MKITGIIKKITYHAIDINTDDYNCGDGIQGIFELYEEVKSDPMQYTDKDDFEDNARQNTESEGQSMNIEEAK